LASMARVAVSASECSGYLRPVLIEPRHRFRPVHGAFVGRERGVFERLLPKLLGGVVDELMQALVAGASFETIGDPCAGPSLPGDVHDAGASWLILITRPQGALL
jgi:hypothetical protein